VARKRTPQDGRDRLEEALATLIQSQAAFVSQLRETDRAHVQFERETAERFVRIEAQMAEIIRVLNEQGRILADHGRVLAEHSRLLERLPDAVRDKIGFKGQQ
jgi:hypothetical protein